MIRIALTKDYKLKGYTLVEGFPGIGLVGPMAGSYIIEKLGMDYIGYIESDLFPPIAVVHQNVPMFTARVYKDDKYKIVVVLSEFSIPMAAVNPLSEELLNFSKRNGLARIVSIGGIPSIKPSQSAYMVSDDSEMMKRAKASGVKLIEEGVIAGVSAMLLIHGAQADQSVTNILVEVNPNVMDPRYAGTAISALNKLLRINIDLKDLEREARAVEAKVRGIMSKAKETSEHLKKVTEGQGPPSYV